MPYDSLMLLDLSFLILSNLFPAVMVLAVRSAFVLAIYEAMILNRGCILEQPGFFFFLRKIHVFQLYPRPVKSQFLGVRSGHKYFLIPTGKRIENV